MDNLNQITAECFNALRQLRLSGFIESMRERAREGGMAQRDADDIAYAVVALADEIAMGKPEPLRGFWMNKTLQLQFFNESLAGEGFFTRLQQLRRDARRQDVLRAYYQCLLFGFQGQYSIRGGELELMRMIDTLRPEIERHIETPEVLSPAGEPPDEPMVRPGQKNLFLWIALGVFAVAIAVFIGLRVNLDRQVSDLGDRVEQLNH
jgi:type VI secretion system protein ImpK